MILYLLFLFLIPDFIISSFVLLPLKATPTIEKNFCSIITNRMVNQQQDSTIIPSIMQDEVKEFKCNFCSTQFPSKNLLFRHLRNDSSCSKLTTMSMERKITMQKSSAALLIGYDSFSTTSDKSEGNNNILSSEEIGSIIKESFSLALQREFSTDMPVMEGEDFTTKVISFTQSTVAKLRHKILTQENGVSAFGDVVIITYRYPVYDKLLQEKKSFQEEQKQTLLQRLINATDSHLNSDEVSSVVKQSCIRILTFNILESNSVHAEKSCTQKAYHYLLPLRWLPGGHEVEQWWLHKETEKEDVNANIDIEKSNKKLFGLAQRGEQRATRPAPNSCLIILKQLLRNSESPRIYNEEEEEGLLTELNSKKSKNRFGSLRYSHRRCWHNFADPSLKGDASPNHDPVWRCVDFCRVVHFIPFSSGNDTEVLALVEVRGDDFVPQQIRRIIGSAVAMAHGLLPSNYFELATRPDVFVESPLAPEDLMYFAGARFHYDELGSKGKSFFDDCTYDDATETQNRILERRYKGHLHLKEKSWIDDLKNNIAPRILCQLGAYNDDKGTDSIISVQDGIKKLSLLNKAPAIFESTLMLLRGIVELEQWPQTSIARSKVIKNLSSNTNSAKNIDQNGSFTIINPNFENGALFKSDQISIPMGNELFPQLVTAVFDLELELAKLNTSSEFIRPASSHCAINRNAQFTPHVDSGRGAGQSLSMIVGLGDYSGGELFIEGDMHDIRYKAKEFDGWKLRHWTAQFNGERFSLVWFTPEMNLPSY